MVAVIYSMHATNNSRENAMTDDAETELLYIYRVVEKATALYKRGMTLEAIRITLGDYFGSAVIEGIINIVEKEGSPSD